MGNVSTAWEKLGWEIHSFFKGKRDSLKEFLKLFKSQFENKFFCKKPLFRQPEYALDGVCKTVVKFSRFLYKNAVDTLNLWEKYPQNEFLSKKH